MTERSVGEPSSALGLPTGESEKKTICNCSIISAATCLRFAPWLVIVIEECQRLAHFVTFSAATPGLRRSDCEGLRRHPHEIDYRGKLPLSLGA